MNARIYPIPATVCNPDRAKDQLSSTGEYASIKTLVNQSVQIGETLISLHVIK